ncbi:MAG TPA: DUF3105 domain-containing protein [Rubrobacteraceae bacterium]|nr:DUF3105 domain-containing protein [Rubrobacteraceae bacterium]
MGKQRPGSRTTPRRLDNAGRERPWGLIIVGGILALVLIAFVTVVVLDSREQAARTPPSEVKTYKVERGHTESNVKYAQSPPVGGQHNPVWQNCGFYSQPVRNENAVHSLEHGAVWITYQPDLPKDQVNTIKDLTESQDYILASPYPGLDSPVVASAWGKQIKLQSANDSGLKQFISAYRKGPQTPEPGASCTNGTGQPG